MLRATRTGWWMACRWPAACLPPALPPSAWRATGPRAGHVRGRGAGVQPARPSAARASAAAWPRCWARCPATAAPDARAWPECAGRRTTSSITTTARRRRFASGAPPSIPSWWCATTGGGGRDGRGAGAAGLASRARGRCCGWRSTTAAARAGHGEPEQRRAPGARPRRQRGYGLGLPRGSAAEQARPAPSGAATTARWRGSGPLRRRCSCWASLPPRGGWAPTGPSSTTAGAVAVVERGRQRRAAMASGADGAADALVALRQGAETGPAATGSASPGSTAATTSSAWPVPCRHVGGPGITPVRATPEGWSRADLLTGCPASAAWPTRRCWWRWSTLLDTGTPIYRLVR